MPSAARRSSSRAWPAVAVISLLLVVGVALATGRSLGSRPAAVLQSPYGASGPSGLTPYQVPLGSSRVYAEVAWPEVEPEQNRFDWRAIDERVTQIARAGLEPMIKITTCGWSSDGRDFWATHDTPTAGITLRLPPGVCTATPPLQPADYDDFVFRVVDRYKDTRFVASPVRYFAINNEVNAPGQWPGIPGRKRCVIDETTGAADCPVFGDYVTMLRRAYGAAHRANPNAIVVDNGLGSQVYGVAIAREKYESGGRTGQALLQAVNFYNAYYRHRYSDPAIGEYYFQYINPSPFRTLRQRFENVLYAPYDPERDPTLITLFGDRFYYMAKHLYDDPRIFDAFQLHFYDEWRFTDEVIDWIHEQMDARWGRRNRKPILCWECGSHWPLADTNGDGRGEYVNYDPDEHASWLTKRFVVALSRGVQHLLHLPLIWTVKPEATELFRSPPLLCSNASTTEPELCGGVADLNRATPAGKAFQTVARTLVGYSSVKQAFVLGSGIKSFRFSSPSGAVVAVWSVQAPQTVDLTRLGTVTAIRDQYGSAVSADPRAFTLTDRVVYVTFE